MSFITAMEGVQYFLEDLGLVQYLDMFRIKGFDSETDISYLDEDDLDSMMITDSDHRHQILQAAAQYRPSEKYQVYEWLRRSGLEHYYINFIQSELTSLIDVRKMRLDDDMYDELEVTLPGHRKRLSRAVSNLQRHERVDGATEQVLACGRWKKPASLSDAKFDFLVVDACICSTKDSSKYQKIEFMVDSGSDVTTIRQDVLDKLDLEILGRIHSKGVHGSKTTNLYKAKILIGNQEMEIEVMGESYDSIGSRVVRHFRHYIDGNHHIWLRGNFCDSDSRLCQTSKLPPILDSNQEMISESVKSAIASSSNNNSITQENNINKPSSPSNKRKRKLSIEEEHPSKKFNHSNTYFHVSPDELDT